MSLCEPSRPRRRFAGSCPTRCATPAGSRCALLPLPGGGIPGELAALDATLVRFGASNGLAIGRSDVHRGAAEGRGGLREAADAAFVTAALQATGGALAYRELGAYRYLVAVDGEEAPRDPHLEAQCARSRTTTAVAAASSSRRSSSTSPTPVA